MTFRRESKFVDREGTRAQSDPSTGSFRRDWVPAVRVCGVKFFLDALPPQIEPFPATMVRVALGDPFLESRPGCFEVVAAEELLTQENVGEIKPCFRVLALGGLGGESISGGDIAVSESGKAGPDREEQGRHQPRSHGMPADPMP